MFDKSRADRALMAPFDGVAGGKGEGKPREPQAFAVSPFGPKQRAWNGRRAAARPIDLERRARFARYDAV